MSVEERIVPIAQLRIIDTILDTHICSTLNLASDNEVIQLRDSLVKQFKVVKKGGELLLRLEGGISKRTEHCLETRGVRVVHADDGCIYVVLPKEEVQMADKKKDGTSKEVSLDEQVSWSPSAGDEVRLEFTEARHDRKLRYLATIVRLTDSKVSIKPKGEKEIWTGMWSLSLENEVVVVWDYGDSDAVMSPLA